MFFFVFLSCKALLIFYCKKRYRNIKYYYYYYYFYETPRPVTSTFIRVRGFVNLVPRASPLPFPWSERGEGEGEGKRRGPGNVVGVSFVWYYRLVIGGVDTPKW